MKKNKLIISIVILILISYMLCVLHNIDKNIEKILVAETTVICPSIKALESQYKSTIELIDSNNVVPVVANIKEPKISEDVILLAKTICAEAGYTNKLDMFLVGNVIMNRLESPWFSATKTIKDVIYQKGQYACTWDGNLERAEPNELSIEIATRLINGERLAPKNVIFQSQAKQGDGVWLKVGVHYYCYKNDPA